MPLLIALYPPVAGSRTDTGATWTHRPHKPSGCLGAAGRRQEPPPSTQSSSHGGTRTADPPRVFRERFDDSLDGLGLVDRVLFVIPDAELVTAHESDAHHDFCHANET